MCSTVGATNDLDWRRETLRERGLLSDGLDLLNIYEHYRDTDWPGEEPRDTEPPDLSAHVTRETTLPDGSPWRRTYRLSNGRVIYDYLRPDGSTFIRMPNFSYRAPTTWPSDISRISRDGRVVGGYRKPRLSGTGDGCATCPKANRPSCSWTHGSWFRWSPR